VSVYIYIDKKNRQIYSFMANDLVSTKLSLSSSLTQTFLAYFFHACLYGCTHLDHAKDSQLVTSHGDAIFPRLIPFISMC
jgi:hypothetical protein